MQHRSPPRPLCPGSALPGQAIRNKTQIQCAVCREWHRWKHVRHVEHDGRIVNLYVTPFHPPRL